jgi:hypothetical protein
MITITMNCFHRIKFSNCILQGKAKFLSKYLRLYTPTLINPFQQAHQRLMFYLL